MTNQILNGDCLQLMKQIQGGTIDMVLCDLPYGTTQNKWDVIIPFDLLWIQYSRILKPNGVIVLTAAQPFTSAVVNSNTKLFKYELIWEKPQGTGHLNAKKQVLRSHESILIFYSSQCTYNPQMVEGETRVTKRSGKASQSGNYGNFKLLEESVYAARYPKSVLKYNTDKGGHPTKKPVPLFEYLIKTYTNEGNTVLDNCSGSGTTAIACINTNRKYICMEQDPVYFAQSKERIMKHVLGDLY